MRVVFTPLAERQVDALYRYVSAHAGGSRAEGYIGRIVAFCQTLGSFSQRGTRRDDLFKGLRTIGFERRVTIAFMVTSDAVLIEGVFYGGQDFEATFER